jgi:FkbM family methyltransferase
MLLACLPRKDRLVEHLAMSPPWLKGRTTMRIAGNLLALARMPRERTIRTRIPVEPGYVVEMPVWAGPQQLFADAMEIEHEATTVIASRALAPLCDGMFDVGSHLGGFVWHLAGAFAEGAPFVAVEPSSRLADLLLRNLAANALHERVELLQVAVGASTGEATLYVDEDEPAMTTTVAAFGKAHRRSEERVRIVRLSDLVAGRGCQRALVKIDVEGAEGAALAGLLPAVERVRAVVFEILEPAVRDGFVDHASAALGMHSFHVEGRILRRAPPWDPASEHRNWLFLRGDDHASVSRLVDAGMVFS